MPEYVFMSIEGDQKKDKGTLEIATGVSFGAYGMTLALTVGTICPTCIIATPAFLGYGFYKRQKARIDNKTSLQTAKNSE